jgi:cell wall-associated NlpC family hydrolase
MTDMTQFLTRDRLRQAIIDEAKTWVSTPYHHEGHRKGIGVDCAHLLNEVYSAAGVIEKLNIEHYSQDWQFHRDVERYLSYIECRATEQMDVNYIPQPADIMMFKFGRTFSHGAIVVRYPIIIHSYVRMGCVLDDVSKNQWLQRMGENKNKPRPRRVFTLHGLE